MAKPVKTVRYKTRGGKTVTRYKRGGKFISNASAKRSRTAKRRRTTSNPMPKAAAKRLVRKQRAGKLAGQLARKKAATKDPKRVAAGKKAARTKAAKKLARSKAAKKGASKRKKTVTKGRKKVAKKRITKAMRRRWGRKGGLAAARKRRAKGRKTKTAAPKRRRKKAGRKRKVIGTLRLPALKKGRKTKKKVRHYVRKGKRRYTIGRKKNPMTAMKSALKSGLMFWAGLTGMQVINNALRQHVTARFAASIPAQIAPMLPSVAGFLLSTLVVPKVTKKKAFVDALQMGATVAMFNAAFNTFVKPSLPATMAPYFAGYGEFVAYEPVAGLDEYVDYDNRLGEYVQDNRYGQFQVTEALASGLSMEEVDYMQRGGAGGSFAKTSLVRG